MLCRSCHLDSSFTDPGSDHHTKRQTQLSYIFLKYLPTYTYFNFPWSPFKSEERTLFSLCSVQARQNNMIMTQQWRCDGNNIITVKLHIYPSKSIKGSWTSLASHLNSQSYLRPKLDLTKLTQLIYFSISLLWARHIALMMIMVIMTVTVRHRHIFVLVL